MNLAWSLILQAVLIFLNAVFAMAEIAVISSSESRLNKAMEEGDRRAGRLLKLKNKPAKFLSTIQVAITLSGFLGSAFAAENFSDYLVSFVIQYVPDISVELLDSISVILITLLLAYFSLIFGELVPKRIAMRKAEKIAMGLSGAVCTVSKIFAPLVWILTLSTDGILRLLRIDPNMENESVGEEDILMMAEAGAEKGEIDEEEREIIENIFEFDDLAVGEIATHRTDVVLLWMEESEEEWEKTIGESRYTFYPICEESIDHIVGVLDTKDYFRLKDKSRKEVMEKAVRTPFFVPEGVKADVVFRNMKKKGTSFAIVLDEYAGFSGILTLKNLIECIVGDIGAAFEPEKEEEIQQIDENKWRINGNVSLALLSRTIDTDFPDEFDTFNGMVFALHGAVPEDGSQFSVETEKFHIEVLDVQDHQVVASVFTLLPSKTMEEEL